tara:strand:+ start:1485 stop:2984 length:1500 start_codon:yes stop_codon:yes gene_type:complete
MSAFIGIDLGTTFSAISYIDETGRPKIIPNKEGKNITPSVVSERDGKIEVGEFASKTWAIEPDKAAARFKRVMSDKSLKFKLGDKEFSPAELSSFVLRKLIQDTKNVTEEIEEVVITIPANFSNEAREATMEAGKLAGLDVNFIINEPTAAALYYAFAKEQELSGYYAVYDLGGGTFDISVIKVTGQDVEIISSNGIEKCGGDDFDKAIYSLIEKKYEEKTGEKINPLDFSLNDAEEEKKTLSNRDKTLAKVGQELIEVTREEFIDSIDHIILQTELLCEKTIEESGIEVKDIKEVFLSGGSTRIPKVLESVEAIFNKVPTNTVNVDEVVALGASLYAAYKGDRSKLSAAGKASVEKIKILDVTNKCFGVIAIGFNESKNVAEERNSIIIEKGENIPVSKTESFYTVIDNQETVALTVTESVQYEEDPRFVKTIWDGVLELENPETVNQGDEVLVTYAYDENQIMKCKFSYKGKETVEVDLSMNTAGNDTVDSDEIEVL